MKFFKFSSRDHVPPKIIKNRLNFAPTYVYTGQQNQVNLKIRDFENKFYLKFTPPQEIYENGAVAVIGSSNLLLIIKVETIKM